ncbi:MAG: sugar transferase [Aliifodinibius sp.]|nr:sugar transferase [Fodinibius sp.]NIY27707.1 sugar transferase [Fodinibius sp.]
MERQLRFLLKRIFDICAAVVLIVLLFPLFLLVALLVKVDSPGPVFYRHFRAGKDGSLFLMWKFRTMKQDADKIGPGLTQDNDPRITRVGRYLRWLCLDEFPQLFNVLRGEMSLVGPRPEIPEIVRTYSEQQSRALSVKPGITGLSQINGRDDLPINEKLQYEIEYVDRWSLGLDLKILLKTIPAIVTARGNRY